VMNLHRCLLLASVILVGCISPPYSERAYSDAVKAKVEGRELVTSSNQEYQIHESDVVAYRKFLIECYEYARGRGPRNRNARHQWAVILSQEGGSIGEYLMIWKKQRQIDEFTRTEFEKILEDQFDLLIELERKRKIL
jgi:hypothetical protein